MSVYLIACAVLSMVLNLTLPLTTIHSNCRNGDLEHISFGHCETLKPTGVPTLQPHLTPPGPTPIPSTCYPGWTAWMSASTPTVANTGDVETVDGLRMVYSFCEKAAMESIECRVVGEATASQYSGRSPREPLLSPD